MSRQPGSSDTARDPTGRIEHLFVIRIWLEAGGSVTWRGMVKHIPSEKQRYFASLRTLNEFLANQLESPDAKVGESSDSD